MTPETRKMMEALQRLWVDVLRANPDAAEPANALGWVTSAKTLEVIEQQRILLTAVLSKTRGQA